MSTNSDCEFIEPQPGKWYYILEHTHADKNAWDWRENADCYGPFASYEEAQQHLSDYHANPGGWSTTHYYDGYTSDEMERGLINSASRPEQSRTYRRFL